MPQRGAGIYGRRRSFRRVGGGTGTWRRRRMCARSSSRDAAATDAHADDLQLGLRCAPGTPLLPSRCRALLVRVRRSGRRRGSVRAASDRAAVRFCVPRGGCRMCRKKAERCMAASAPGGHCGTQGLSGAVAQACGRERKGERGESQCTSVLEMLESARHFVSEIIGRASAALRPLDPPAKRPLGTPRACVTVWNPHESMRPSAPMSSFGERLRRLSVLTLLQPSPSCAHDLCVDAHSEFSS
ncbi:hypothetical protein B0H17DRAFT_545684 [Mycena rosella]|uniref:Uncharacterized protein n=1 Tax=Mycena rosella TaxID=1033263 RepID=A0AAD7FN06_MYCRO|nr:hypothetical protein B0H17DRAFT_545684 [Mycena rosella]